ncbi:MAG: VanW family protein [Chloroflexi bacterium]|nr:VanW family protein [Chloroflexota bacterium]MBP8058254.1 VanW family protein [Chloroflexota bacterium]
MQATETMSQPATSGSLAHKISWFLLPPITAFVLVTVLLAGVMTNYQLQHENKIYTGVTVWGQELGQMTEAEAAAALAAAFPYPGEKAIVFTIPGSAEQWEFTPTELGITFDVAQTVAAAYAIGREDNSLQSQLQTWYYGTAIAPVVVFDEAKIDAVLNSLAAQINQPSQDATLLYTGSEVDYTPAQFGRILDVDDARARLLNPLADLRNVELELLVHQLSPQIMDTAEAARQIEQIISGPMTFYLQEPLAGVDLDNLTIDVTQLTGWLRIALQDTNNGSASYHVTIDENALRHWLSQYTEAIYREPVSARFYFNDSTRQLVLVEPHISGRTLDIEATIAQFMAQVTTPNRSIPFVLEEIVPVVNSNATGEELGITELVSESTTWFYGSTDSRKHNIARAAANFYGIVIAPGEEFSFNKYLGPISAEDGYETGLIIVGGRTIKGVGGGVCQVSTTVFQAAFWAGFPIVERWAHGYQVGYYNDGEGAGMDATVFSPIVDFKFINNTPHYLLMENYYNEQFQSLTVKFYSTSMDRSIVKSTPFIENETPANPDIYEFNPEIPEGTVEQVDWAVGGSRVTITREVYNYNGDLILEDVFVSNYIPWQNVYQYGPNTEGYPDSFLYVPPAEEENEQ